MKVRCSLGESVEEGYILGEYLEQAELESETEAESETATETETETESATGTASETETEMETETESETESETERTGFFPRRNRRRRSMNNIRRCRQLESSTRKRIKGQTAFWNPTGKRLRNMAFPLWRNPLRSL